MPNSNMWLMIIESVLETRRTKEEIVAIRPDLARVMDLLEERLLKGYLEILEGK
jgi:hypothetical protein